MPGLHIDLTAEEYEKIPKPKRAWVRDLVREVLKTIHLAEGKTPEEWVGPETEKRYYFRSDGRVLSATGGSPAQAAGKLGLGLTTEWRDEAEAIRDGWVQAPTMPEADLMAP